MSSIVEHAKENKTKDLSLAELVENNRAKEVPDHCVFKYRKDNIIREGDFVIFWVNKDLTKQVQIVKGGQYQTRDGKFFFKHIIDKCEFGSKLYSHNMKGQVIIMRPNSHMYSTSLMQRTQILYTPDISMIVQKLQLRPGMRVVESGTGTGSLSVSMTKALFPKGELFTYEFNEHRMIKAGEDFIRLGLDEYVTVTHRDVLENGFLLDDKVTPSSIDACFLDLPRPETAVKHAYQILKPKARICNFSPCIEQVQKVSQELASTGFYDIRTFECLSREILQESFHYNSIYKNKDDDKEEQVQAPVEKKKQGNRMKDAANKRKLKSLSKTMYPVSTQQGMMRGHTGYLTFAIKF